MARTRNNNASMIAAAINTASTELPRSALATIPSPHLTQRYRFVDTNEVINTLKGEGFEVTAAAVPTKRVGRPTSARTAAFGKHVITFTHPDVKAIDGVMPRFLFQNSHDGTGNARALLGAFRFACSNGLVIGTTYGMEQARHSANQTRDIIERIQRLARNTQPLFAKIEEWSAIELTESQVYDFARMAAVLRWNDADKINATDLVEVRRPEDEGRSLWKVYNRVQEATTNVSLTGQARTGRVIHTSPIIAPNAALDYNSRLWDMADGFAKL